MSGYSRIRRTVPLIVGVGLLCLPSILQAQTAAERARAEELARAVERVKAEELAQIEEVRAQLLERFEFTEQERLEKVAKAEFRIQRELTRAKAIQEARAQELQEIHQERALEVETRMLAVQEAHRSAQEHYQEARQEALKAQQVMVQVKSRVRLGVSLDGTQGPEYDSQGVRLAGTVEESPAEEAGLQEGDIITHLNGQSLLDPIPQEAEADFDDEGSLPVQRLMALVQEMEPEEDVEVRYLRDGSPQTVSFQTADVEEPTITIVRGGEGEEGAYRVLRSPGGEAVYRMGPERGGEAIYRVRPEQGGVWTFEGPDKELVELQISKIKELKELGELEHLAEIEDLQVHLKDLQVEVQNLDDIRKTVLIKGHPGSEANSWTFRSGDGSPQLYALGGSSAVFGLKLAEMNPGLAEYFTSDEGLLVLEVPEDSPLGLAPGDVILAIDGRGVTSQRDVRRVLGSYEEDEAVSFTVIRKGRETTVEGSVG